MDAKRLCVRPGSSNDADDEAEDAMPSNPVLDPMLFSMFNWVRSLKEGLAIPEGVTPKKFLGGFQHVFRVLLCLPCCSSS